PQSGDLFEARRYVNPVDLFGVQANIITVSAHFIGIIAPIWLYSRVNR
ncbi:MAG: DUF3611 family protein, partial [Symploca sp. SIO2G7]|nr:DUF3611 family protein [Symploca sp. SIO2G7]